MKHVMKENTAVTMPTLGFQQQKTIINNQKLTFLELGGQKQLRSNWPDFFSSINLLIWVIDSSDQRRMNEVSLELDVVLTAL